MSLTSRRGWRILAKRGFRKLVGPFFYRLFWPSAYYFRRMVECGSSRVRRFCSQDRFLEGTFAVSVRAFLASRCMLTSERRSRPSGGARLVKTSRLPRKKQAVRRQRRFALFFDRNAAIYNFRDIFCYMWAFNFMRAARRLALAPLHFQLCTI